MLFPELAPARKHSGPPPLVPPAVHDPEDLGEDYRPADESAAQAERDPFPVDPAVVERGIRSHAQLQNRLAQHLVGRGVIPKRPRASDPQWDLLWREDGVVWVAEVKSLTASNEERQLRIGLGQLLRYRHRLAAAGIEARAAMFVERSPTDPEWISLCDDLDVLLAWPSVLEERL